MTQSDIINNNFSKAFECIKCSNAYNTGEVLNEEKLFKQISERKHSTFDLSKFTVVGSPTITEDGIASGFSVSNYITTPSIDFTGKTFRIKAKITGDTFVGTNYGYYFSPLDYEGGIQLYRANTNLVARCRTNNSGTFSNEDTTILTNFEVGKYYDVDIEVVERKMNVKVIKEDGTEYNAGKSLTADVYFPSSTHYLIGLRYTTKINNPCQGSIDLKQFSITVDGKEVFSGNKTGLDVINDIEIPYTLSKTGSKIVDVAYRDRVIDLYEQQGHAKYYTIDEPNKNFTLPMGEIYGMIGNSSSTGGSGLEICDIGMALYVDETKGLRRYLNGQIVDINTNTQAFLNRLKEITTLHPSLLCTEEEWQTAKTMSAFGQVGKFVFNYSGDEIVSVRLPRVVNIQGLFDLQNLGMTVSAGLPNITFDGINTMSGPEVWWGANNGAIVTTKRTNWSGYSTGSNILQARVVNFNASRSNSIYGNSNTVQQEAIQYPYFIQIATGSETENNIINDIELNNPFSLFDSKYSDHELNNLSWLKSEGQWNAKAVYTDAYNKLLKVYNGTETVEGLSVKLSTETYTDYDFVLNTTDETFRLPLLDGSEDLISDKFIGRSFTATNSGYIIPITKNGQISIRIYGNGNSDVTVNKNGNAVGTFNLQSSIYQQGTITTQVVKGDTIKVFTNASGTTATCNYLFFENTGNGSLYFYVGETVQNANLIDAGRISEAIHNKLDKKQLYNKITNCLLEVPQRIKYTLENGILTIKAGSVVIVPYGTEDKTADLPKGATFINDNFKVYDTQFSDGKFFVWAESMNDIPIPNWSTVTGVCMLGFRFNSWGYTTLLPQDNYSGDTKPVSTTGSYWRWYDTNANKIKYTADNGASWVSETCTLPFMITNVVNGVHTSIDHVFNGMGYIGSTVWIDKGVRGLHCNGKNDDETVRNIDHTTSKLIIISVPNATLSNLGVLTDINDNIGIGLYRSSRTEFGRRDFFTFNIVRNYIYTVDNSEFPRLLNMYIDVIDGKISKFSPAILVQCADAQSSINRNGDSMVGCLTLGGLNGSDSSDALIVRQRNAKKLGATSYSNIYFKNADGEDIAILGGIEGTDNGTGLRFLLRNRTKNQWEQLFNLISNAGGSAMYTINSSVIGSVLNTAGISKAGAGYVLFGNGIIIQWGTTGVSTHGTIYYPVSLPMQPRVVITPYGGSISWSKSCIGFSNDGSHFNFARVDACEHMWIAIGWLF